LDNVAKGLRTIKGVREYFRGLRKKKSTEEQVRAMRSAGTLEFF
jgi:hypothetical protein